MIMTIFMKFWNNLFIYLLINLFINLFINNIYK